MHTAVHHFFGWMLILGVYVANSFPKEGSFKIPAAVGGVAAIVLLLLNLNKIRMQHLKWILAVAALCFASMTLRAYTWPEVLIQGHIAQHFASWIVLIYAIVISYSAYLELIQWNRDQIEPKGIAAEGAGIRSTGHWTARS